MMFLTILAFVIAGSILGLTGGIFLLLKKNWISKYSIYLVNFAAGALLSVAFLDLIPEALEISTKSNVLLYSLLGIISFFFLEHFLIWHHHHAYGKKEMHSFVHMVLIGDTIHNFIDGIIIALTFLISIPLGVSTSIAVFLHELPQEIGDFGVLLYAKLKRSKIIIYNLISSFASIIGATLAYFYISAFQSFNIFLISFTAGAFIYIASTDLLPEAKKHIEWKKNIIQAIMLILGIILIWTISNLEFIF
jgi:zinc and cadmium transporter